MLARRHQRGNVFALLFGATALVGVLASVGMQTVVGPVTTVARVTSSNLATNQAIMAARILVNASADADADGVIEPPAFRGLSPAPVGGGQLPAALGLSLTDPWGTPYGYCVWDHGTVRGSAGRLNGDNTATAGTQALLAVITAGPDKQFQTTCAAYAGGPVDVTKAAGSDDFLFRYTYAEAAAVGGDLWKLNPNDANTAELPDDTGTARVSVDRSGGILSALAVSTGLIAAPASAGDTLQVDGGLRLDTQDGAATTCGAGQAGALRLTADRAALEICDGSAFVALVPPTPGTAGALLFNDAGTMAGTAGVTWDKARKSLFVGGPGPEPTDGYRRLHVVGEDGTAGIAVERFGGPAKLTLAGGGGSLAAPAETPANMILGQVIAKAYHAGGWPSDGSTAEAVMAFRLTGAGTSATAYGTRYTLQLKPDGGTAILTRHQIDEDGTQYLNGPAVYLVRNEDTANPGTFILRRSRGTNAAPSALVTSDNIGAIAFTGRSGAGYAGAASNTAEAYILARLAGTGADASNMGTNLMVFTKADGSATSIERLRITAAGIVVGGGGTLTTPRSALHVNGAVQVGDDTAACASSKNGALRYASATLHLCRSTTWETVRTTAAPVTWGRVSAAGAIVGGSNIASAARNGAGDYTLTFTSSMGTAAYAVGLTPHAASGVATMQVATASATAATVRCFINGAAADCDFSIQIEAP